MNENEMSTFGQWLAQRRKELDLTQKDLAHRIGCAPITLRKIESGHRRPSRQIAALLAEQLGVPLNERSAFVKFARGESTFHWQSPPANIPVDAPWRVLSRHHSNLPTPLTRLIGRERELASINQVLARGARLVTLTGPPGIGKTHLAIELAHRLPEYRDGVFFVTLAPLRDPALVLPAIGTTLQLTGVQGKPLLETLAEFLHDKHILLVLDNFEQVLPAAPLVVELLTACAGLNALVTSRQALHVRGEQQFLVPPLELPAWVRPASLSVLLANPAIALFIERGQSVQPDFRLTEQNWRAVVEICHRVEGVPLAIELAAARLASFSPQQIAEHLSRRLAFLTRGPRDLPLRHQTLRDAIAWSFELLTPPEQMVFRRLSVFSGGFTLDAARAVCESAAGSMDNELAIRNAPSATNKEELSATLASLVDKSLVRREGDTRWTMLETIREYARDKLAESREWRETHDRHLNFFLTFAEELEPELHGPRQRELLNRLEGERDNFRAALDWCQQGEGAVDKGLRLAGALRGFWDIRAYHSEAVERLQRLLARQSLPVIATLAPEHAPARAKALNAAGFMHAVQGNSTAACRLVQEAFALARAHGDRLNQAWSLHILAREMLARGEHDAAQQYIAHALQLWQQVQGAWGIADSLNSLGEIALLQGDAETARLYYEEAVVQLRHLQDYDLLAFPLRRLGQIALHQGQYERATALCRESLALNVQVGSKRGIAACLATGGAILAAQGETELGARVLGAASALLDAIHAQLSQLDRLEYERGVETVHTCLSARAFSAAWASGRALTLTQALQLVLGGR